MAEAAILINYTSSFTNLLENVERAVRILGVYLAITLSQPGIHVCACDVFFRNFTNILQITGLGYKFWKS